MWAEQGHQWICQTEYGELKAMSNPGEEHTNWLSRNNSQPWKHITSNIIWNQKIIFRNIYVYTTTSMHSIIINEKEAINLKHI